MRYLLFTCLCVTGIFLSSCTDNKGSTVEKPGDISISADSINIEIEEEFKDMDFVMGKFNPSLDSNFIWIDTMYTDKPKIYLQKESYNQFLKMRAHALEDSIELFILSATRPFDYQKRIWERKWNKYYQQGMRDSTLIAAEILKYSAMPGTSRHHWGTDIDLNYLSNSWFEEGKGKKIYDWLQKHAADYGFCQPYTPKGTERLLGYEEEKWHWSYKPLAKKYYHAAEKYLNNDMIEGFSGAKAAVDLKVVESYVLSIDPDCK